jgi:SAM-dependent methyltransferase
VQIGNCRFCNRALLHLFCDLGMSPLSNAFLGPDDLQKKERFYPLRVYVCDSCLLVQLMESEDPEHIFSDYVYFSSYSDSWLKHARNYAEKVDKRFSLGSASLVVEIASNDGYLLQYFKQKNIPVLGIEPAANVAKVAQDAGIPTKVQFFGIQAAKELAAEGKRADLLVGNNVLAHVPDLNDFVKGMKILLKPQGVITVEVPHLLRLMEENQFDTIYHEHFSYFSFTTAEKVFAQHGLVVFDVEELPTHGGSLRIFGRHAEDDSKPVMESVKKIKQRELQAGLNSLAAYGKFGERAKETKRKLLDFLLQAKREAKTVVGYGAPAKGNTLLNYCGIGPELVAYTVDRSPHKQGRFLPGTHIPIYHPEKIKETKPDYLLILPWNLKDEIMEQMAHIRRWGGKFVLPIPRVTIL